MANIEKRTAQDGVVTFRVKVRLRGFPAQTASFDRLTDAKRWAQQTEVAIREGRYFKTTESRKHTLSEMVDRYIQYELPKKPKSYDDQVVQISWWKETLGFHVLSDITSPLIAEYRDRLSQGITVRGTCRAPATVNRYLAILSHAFTIAIKEWGWIEHNPVLKVSKLKEPRGRIRFLADDERVRLLEACKNSDNQYLYCIVVLALSTGARKMEILNLRWSNIDFERNKITLHETKNGERRVLPLAGHAFALMKDLSKIRNIKSDLVFPGKNFLVPIDIKSAWETAVKKSEVTDFRFHDLRHSAASYLAMNNASISEIAAVLGHKTLEMVKRYAHLSEAHTARVVASMNEQIFCNV